VKSVTISGSGLERGKAREERSFAERTTTRFPGLHFKRRFVARSIASVFHVEPFVYNGAHEHERGTDVFHT
jgi:hypothetical protein